MIIVGVRQVLESLLEGVSGYVITLSLRLTPLSDVILPPMSSRLLKYLVFESPCFSDIRGIINSRSSFKNVTLFAIRRGGRRLYSTRERQDPLVARSGEVLLARLALYSRELPSYQALFGCNGVLRFSGSSIAYSIDEVTIEDVNSITVNLSKGSTFKLVIHTPLLLPSKLMTPPPLTVSKLISSIKSGYRLLPTPSYILSAACREWIGVVRGERVREHIAPYVLGRLADIAIYELDVNIKPVTVIYGRDDKGKLRLVRGPVGYIIYKLESKRLEKIVDKLLAFTTRIGLGKSRSIGFGEIEIQPLSKTQETSNSM